MDYKMYMKYKILWIYYHRINNSKFKYYYEKYLEEIDPNKNRILKKVIIFSITIKI